MVKKIYRSQEDKMVAGICGGLAEYLEIDSTVVRLVFAALGFMTALLPMFLFYIVAWIIIPSKQDVVGVNPKADRQETKRPGK